MTHVSSFIAAVPEANGDNSTAEEPTKHKFNWEKVISTLLKKQDDQTLAVKKLRKKVRSHVILYCVWAFF